MEIKKNSRQVPSTKEICSNKKYNDIIYAYLQYISTKDTSIGKRLVRKKDVNFSSWGKYFGLSRQTVSTKFKNLINLGLVSDYSDEYYEVIQLDNTAATLIPYHTLKVLTDTLSENAISTYVYLLNRYFANEQNPFQFTLEQIKSYVGIATTTRSNDNIITNILFVLQKIGLIEYSLTTLAQPSDGFNNVKTIYELEKIDNIIKC